MKKTKIISTLLIVSAVNLALMVPGGFIESRDFSHISPIILGGFNIFLTLLGMVSLFLVYFVSKKRRWALKTAFICGLSYFIVYTIDLAEIFPKTPTAMPLLLLVLEILGTVLSIPLMYYSTLKITIANNKNEEKTEPNKYIYWLIGLAILLSIGIIIFATKSAMTAK